MPRITPALWFDKGAKEPAEFYTTLFPRSKVTSAITLQTPAGSCDVVTFELAGQPFSANSAGPTFNPSISLYVKLPTKEEVTALWEKLSPGGQVLMPLDAYPFSDHFGWVVDKYGLSWQVSYDKGRKILQTTITPMFLFVGTVCGKAEEAVSLYTSIFRNSQTLSVSRHGASEAPDKEGTIKHATFQIESMEFSAMDSAHDHRFAFNEAISFQVLCDTQEEIDYYWEKLSADPAAEQCGWLKDRFGVSWQIIPATLGEMMTSSKERTARVASAFMKMKKFDIATLQQAFEGKQ